MMVTLSKENAMLVDQEDELGFGQVLPVGSPSGFTEIFIANHLY